MKTFLLSPPWKGRTTTGWLEVQYADPVSLDQLVYLPVTLQQVLDVAGSRILVDSPVEMRGEVTEDRQVRIEGGDLSGLAAQAGLKFVRSEYLRSERDGPTGVGWACWAWYYRAE